MFYGMDPLYWVVFILAMILSLVAQLWVKTAFNKYNKIENSKGMTGAEAAKEMLAEEGISNVKILCGEGWLSDHYNPMTKTINLSPDVYNGKTLSAVGVACHEAGHALQHAHGYALLQLRSWLVPTCSFSNIFAIPLIIIGMILGAGYLWMSYIGLALFSLIFVFQLVTLPVEIDASARAKEALINHGITRGVEENSGVAEVLRAAAFTYVAAAISTLLTLLYYAHRLGLFGNDRK